MPTSISTEVIELSDLFPASDEGEVKSGLFSNNDDVVDLTKEKEDNKKEPVKIVEEKIITEHDIEDIKKTLGDKTKDIVEDKTPVVLDEQEEQEEFDTAKQGKKADLVEFFKNKIESGDIFPFQDYDETKQTLDTYLASFKTKDFDELWKANLDQKRVDIEREVPEQFKNSLPEELKYAAQYAADGGTDWKGLFKVLAQVEEVKALDPTTHPREVAKQYLTATDFGSEEEINEQLNEWEDGALLVKKAQGFKPKLDKMEENIVRHKLAKQAELKEEGKREYTFYVDNVVNAIKDQNINGIPIDKKTQAAMYSGLTQYNFIDTRGNKCSEFSYLLDKAIWSEPDYETVAMAYWMFSDKEGFMNAVANNKVNEKTNAFVRTLKSEMGAQGTAKAEYNEPPKPVIKRNVAKSTSLFRR